jgi:hypothetical protein
MAKKERIPTYLLSLAGEHRAASELCRRGVFATITPGNRKQTDLYAINHTTKQFLRIEVKASLTEDFVTGISQRKGDPPDFWVLASFKEQSERLFVLKNDEIERLQQEANKPYLERFRKRNPGQEYDIRKGVDTLPLADVENANCEDCWDKIVAAVGGAEARTSGGAP